MYHAVDNSSFWDEIYKSNNDGWDLGTPNPVFEFLIDKKLLTPCSLLIVGCGKGYDALLAAKSGFYVTALDFSNCAISSAKKLALEEKVEIDFIQKDVFQLDESFVNRFDAIYEYTTYCAINPSRREEFAKIISSLLVKNGKLFSLVFPIDGRAGGPPFNINYVEYYEKFSKYLKLEYFSRRLNSVKPRRGKEVLQIFRK